jgi:hypothetical protein
MVTSLQEVLSLQVTDRRRVYSRPRCTDLAIGEELTRAQGVLGIRGLGGRVASLDLLRGLSVSALIVNRLTVGA